MVDREPQEEVAKTSEPKPTDDELKVVIVLKGNRAMVGVQSPDCDPVFTTLEGNMAAALSQVPALVESANAKWDANPRNPKADLPEPPPSPTSSRSQPAQSSEKPKQPSFF
ncbi:hypothetical protein ES703_66983 [subsurface metagenome]|nr:hypothetical protein [Dehalococcoidia bacterium]